MENVNQSKRENCVQCVHYSVTWDPSFPRGCGLFGFKTSKAPSALVMEATGGKCGHFVSKSAKRKK